MLKYWIPHYHPIGPCSNVTCSIPGETCKEGLCMCGTVDSCANKTSGSYCQADQNQCKCSKDVEACAEEEECKNGMCGKSCIVHLFVESILPSSEHH